MNTSNSSSPSGLVNSVISNTNPSSNNVNIPSMENVSSKLSDGLSSMESSAGNEISSSNSEGSWFGLSTMQIVIIIILLAFLGFNIFRYMDVILSKLVEIVSPIFKSFGVDLSSATKNIIKDTATGTKAGVDIAAGVADNTINVLSGSGGSDTSDNTNDDTSSDDEDTDAGNTASSPPAPPVSDSSSSNDKSDMLNNAINRIKSKDSSPDVKPDSSDSKQQGRGVAKNPGFCYIGTDRGYRSCAHVNDSSECESGDMFKTMAQCVNGGGQPIQSNKKEIMHPEELAKHIGSDIYDAL